MSAAPVVSLSNHAATASALDPSFDELRTVSRRRDACCSVRQPCGEPVEPRLVGVVAFRHAQDAASGRC